MQKKKLKTFFMSYYDAFCFLQKTKTFRLKKKTTFHKKQKKVLKKNFVFFVNSSRKNVFCTFVDLKNKKIKKSKSSGVMMAKNAKEKKIAHSRCSRLSTFFFIECFKKTYLRRFSICLLGSYKNYIGAIQGFENCSNSLFIKIIKFQEIPLKPHNGCRLFSRGRKKRRTHSKTST